MASTVHFGRYPIFLSGSLVSIPAISFRERYRNSTMAKMVQASLLLGAGEEWKEHPSFTDKQVLQIAADHISMDPRYYLKELKKGM